MPPFQRVLGPTAYPLLGCLQTVRTVLAVLQICSYFEVAEPNVEDICAFPAPILSILRQPRHAHFTVRSKINKPTLLTAGGIAIISLCYTLAVLGRQLQAITQRSRPWHSGDCYS